jgi:hypothetical protein
MEEANYKKINPLPDAAFASMGEVSASDPCLYEQMVRPWVLANTPLDSGAFGYRMHYLQTPAVTLYRERFDLGCRVQGLSPPNVFAFSVPLHMGRHSNFWGAPLHKSGFPATLPGGLDAEMNSGQEHLIVLVDLSLFHRHLPVELCNDLLRAADKHLLPARAAAVNRFGNRPRKWRRYVGGPYHSNRRALSIVAITAAVRGTDRPVHQGCPHPARYCHRARHGCGTKRWRAACAVCVTTKATLASKQMALVTTPLIVV